MKKLEIALKVIQLIKGGTLLSLLSSCLIILHSLFKDKMILINGFENKNIGLGLFILFCLLLVLLVLLLQKITSTMNIYYSIVNNVVQIGVWGGTIIYTVTAFFQKPNHLGEVFHSQLFSIQKSYTQLEKQEWLTTIRETCCSNMSQKVWEGIIKQVDFEKITNYNSLVESLRNQLLLVQKLSSNALTTIQKDYESPINKFLKECILWMVYNPVATVTIISTISLGIYIFKDMLSESFMLIGEGFKKAGTLSSLMKDNSTLSLEISSEIQALAKVMQNNQISILQLENGLSSVTKKIEALSHLLGETAPIVKSHCDDINALSHILFEIKSK